MIVELFAGPLDGTLLDLPPDRESYPVHQLVPGTTSVVSVVAAGEYVPGPPQLPAACTGRLRPPVWTWRPL